VSRADRKNAGRFSTDAETRRIYSAIEGWSDSFGDYVAYFRLDTQATQYDEVYEEAIGPGRVYAAPINLRCIHVTHVRGENDNGEYGFYYSDDLIFPVQYDIFIKSGMSLADVETESYERDRVVYDQKVFRITKISIEGKIQKRPTVVSFEATQMKRDELVDDAQFSQFANASDSMS
jgi:hypothetical protein